jgi:hypothetical protein
MRIARSRLLAALAGLLLVAMTLVAFVLLRLDRPGAEAAAVPPAGVVIGVNVTNPHQLPPEERRTILDELSASGVRVIRSPLVDDSSSISSPGRTRWASAPSPSCRSSTGPTHPFDPP